MNADEKVKVVQQMYADFGQGNIPSVLNVMADDVIWRQPAVGPAPFAGTVRGREQLGKWFGQLDATSDVEAFEPKDFIAQGDKVVVLGYYKYRAKSTGKTWESDWAMVWTFRNGKLAEGQILEDTLAQAVALDGGNKSILQKAITHWNNGNLDAYLELYAPNAMAHHVPAGFPSGVTGIRKFYEGIWTTFSKCEIVIQDLFEEDNKVACRYTVNATHRETGEEITMRSITTLHFSNGKCVERWDAEEN